MTLINRQGSVLLLALTALTVLFILGFAITFFTGSEDWSSSISYESEVAFNLAESAIEEFLARLKNSLNHDDANNQLFKVLRSHSVDVTKEIPLEAAQVARLTTFTRETARQIYGIQFGQGMVTSNDFNVSATLKLKHMNPIEARLGSQLLYTFRPDKKEKQGELAVTATVTYRGKTAKVSLTFLIRVVKSFVPPFNYFTLYVKDGTIFGGSHYNVWQSTVGEQEKNLRLDNGWRFLPGQQNFNALSDASFWEKALAEQGNNAFVPPGRIYMGQDPEAQFPPSIILQSTNGTKLLTDHPSDGVNKLTQINGQENFFLKFDVPWTGLRDYVKKFMELQGQDKGKSGLIFNRLDNETEIRVRNVGSGFELIDTSFPFGEPTFVNALQSFKNFRNTRLNTARNNDERMMYDRLYPPLENSGLDLFGYAQCVPPLRPKDGVIRSEFLSPTIVYGPVWRMYYRIMALKTKSGTKLELPFLGIEPPSDGSAHLIPLPVGFDRDKQMNATQAREIMEISGVPEDHRNKMLTSWQEIPERLKEPKEYEKYMSNAGVEPYNAGLGNLLMRVQDKMDNYDGPLKDHLLPFMANEAYPGMPGPLSSPVTQSPIREFYEGDLWHALPEGDSLFLLDFYFMPRATEDFFRGRTTVSIGGSTYDRFDFKYINDVRSYLSGAKHQTLELNGILTLNDMEPLLLRDLNFRGRGVIYSSPMMGGGKVVISGDFYPESLKSATNKAYGSNANNDMMTIVAPQIVIDTDSAQSDPCYIEANLISVLEPIRILGTKQVHIKGSVVVPRLNLEETFDKSPGGVIIYNPLNTIWRKDYPGLMDQLYIAKIVTGGVGKFDWQYER